MGVLDELVHRVFVMQGSIPGQTKMSDESLFYVYREVWQRNGLLNTAFHGGYHNKADAERRAEEVRKEYPHSR